MDLVTVRKSFFEKYPDAKAFFEYNEKLGCLVCYAYNLNQNATSNDFLL